MSRVRLWANHPLHSEYLHHSGPFVPSFNFAFTSHLPIGPSCPRKLMGWVLLWDSSISEASPAFGGRAWTFSGLSPYVKNCTCKRAHACVFVCGWLVPVREKLCLCLCVCTCLCVGGWVYVRVCVRAFVRVYNCVHACECVLEQMHA